jgi:hypothetical protein
MEILAHPAGIVLEPKGYGIHKEKLKCSYKS